MTLTPLQTLALAKALTEATAKKAREQIAPGSYTVTFRADVSVQMNVGQDYDQEIVAKADPWKLLAAALSHLNGVTVASLVREALSDDDALTESIKADVEAAMAEITAKTKTTCKGKVTVPRRIVEVVEADGVPSPEKAPASGLALLFEDGE